MRVGPGSDGKVILEAFKPGTAPPDNYSVIGYGNNNDNGLFGASPDADRAVRRGSGLY
jgi:penicillin-binding protein 1A